MPRLPRFAPVVLAILSIGALDACRRKPAVTSQPQMVNQDSIDRARRAEDDARRRAEEDEARRRAAAAADAARGSDGARAAEIARLREIVTTTVYFDFNAEQLRDDTRAALEAKVPVLVANPTLTIRIAGHTDERGETEYNFALGQRRAASVKRFLVQRGIDASRIETVSFGEEQPADQGSGESAWARNRRAVFAITAGGESLVAPRQ